MPDTAVHNPPAGGDQSQASTNDDNINDALGKPWLVAISDGETVGVFARFASQSEANASAKACKAKRPQKRIEVRVLKENDISNGLPAFVAEVEGARLAVEDETTPAPKK